MLVPNDGLIALAKRIAKISETGKGAVGILKELVDSPSVVVTGSDGVVGLAAHNATHLQVTDGDGKILDQRLFEGRELFLLQQIVVSQFSQLLMNEKIIALEKEAELAKAARPRYERLQAEHLSVHENLDKEGVPRQEDGQDLSLWGRIQKYKVAMCDKTAREVQAESKPFVRGQLKF